MQTQIKEQFDYYVSHQKDLFQKYGEKILVIMNNTVVDVYDDYTVAILESRKKYAPGTYIIQKGGNDESAYTVKFSRPVFN